MNIFIYFFFFVLGSIIGSFLNVVLFRFNTGRTIGGRSKCFSCRRTLQAIDLVPVLSYVVFGGRCRTCRSHVSFQYPLVELLTALLFVGSYALYAPLLVINPALFFFKISISLIVMSLLVLITVYDIKHKIIPDLFAYTFAAVSFLALFVHITPNGYLILHMPAVQELLAGVLLAFPFYFLWLVSRGAWMGLGDAKLALGIGWFLGLAKGATAIVYSFWIGAFVSLMILAFQYTALRSQKLTMKSEIPFAPFLILGLLIVYFFGYNMFSILEIL